MGLKKVMFAAHSFGGAVATCIAVKHPDKIDKLILIDTAGYPVKLALIVKCTRLPFQKPYLKLFREGGWLNGICLKCTMMIIS